MKYIGEIIEEPPHGQNMAQTSKINVLKQMKGEPRARDADRPGPPWPRSGRLMVLLLDRCPLGFLRSLLHVVVGASDAAILEFCLSSTDIILSPKILTRGTYLL